MGVAITKNMSPPYESTYGNSPKTLLLCFWKAFIGKCLGEDNYRQENGELINKEIQNVYFVEQWRPN